MKSNYELYLEKIDINNKVVDAWFGDFVEPMHMSYKEQIEHWERVSTLAQQYADVCKQIAERFEHDGQLLNSF